jgi:hypothetical protein
MDSAIGLPIGIGCAFLFAGILFWYTYRNQIEPEGGRGTEEQISEQYLAQMKREIELENQCGLNDDDNNNDSLETKTSNNDTSSF